MTIRPYTFLVRGAWRCTPTPFLTSTIARLKYRRTTVVTFREQGEKQTLSSIISQASGRCYSRRMVNYSTTDYSELTWVYSKKDTSCIPGKLWPNSALNRKSASFTTVSIIYSISLCCASNQRTKRITSRQTQHNHEFFPLLETANFYNNYFQLIRSISSSLLCFKPR
jgi:hypothetical protein